jgi:hypothetical protein
MENIMTKLKTQISSPVVNKITVRMVLTLICIARWCAMLLDEKGAFLCGNFENGEKIYMEVPQGFEPFLFEECSPTAIENHLWIEASNSRILERTTQGIPMHEVRKKQS